MSKRSTVRKDTPQTVWFGVLCLFHQPRSSICERPKLWLILWERNYSRHQSTIIQAIDKKKLDLKKIRNLKDKAIIISNTKVVTSDKHSIRHCNIVRSIFCNNLISWTCSCSFCILKTNGHTGLSILHLDGCQAHCVVLYLELHKKN